MKLGELNEVAHDLILSIKTDSSVGKVAFGLVRKVKNLEFPKGTCKYG